MSGATPQSAERGSGPAFLPVLQYTTSHLPSDERLADWYDRGWPGQTPVYHTKPTEPFNTRWDLVWLGLIAFVYVEITAMTWERRVEGTLNPSVQPILVSMMVDGLAEGDMDGRPFKEAAGTYHFHDLARPSLHASTASRTFNLSIPRDVAEEWLAPLDDLHGLVIEQEAAKMLFAYAAQVHSSMPRLDPDTAERLGRVFLELLAVAVAAVRPRRPAVKDGLRRRAIEEINRRLGDGDVSVARLCDVLGVTRGRLFKAFQLDGGVQAYVLTQRLIRARTALARVDEPEPVGNLAHRLGFSDASHLSRAFRQRFGMTPRAYRALIEEGRQRSAPIPDGTLVLE